MLTSMHRFAVSAVVVVVVAMVLAAPLQADLTLIDFDDFSDGGFTLTSNQSPTGANFEADVPGGKRAVTFFNSYNAGTLTLDDELQMLSLTSNGLGQMAIGYGYTANDSGAMQNDYFNRLDADWSVYRGVRVNIAENQVRMAISLSFITHPHGSSSTGEIWLENGQTGPVDIYFDDLAGSTDWTQVDYFRLFARNGFVGSNFRISSIQFILPAPGALALLPIAALLNRRRRCNSPRSWPG